MDKEAATRLFYKVDFKEDGSDCWVPTYSTRSVRSGKNMYSLVYLAYVLSGEEEPFRKKQHVPRVCRNSDCFNPNHLMFKEMDRFKLYFKEMENGCWEWVKSKDGGGYGVFVSNKYGKEKAHRVAYMEWVGEIPSGMFICHKCDNPSCCNPDHLFLGTHTDNMRDMLSKNRQVFLMGEDCAQAKLTKENVLSMRKDYSSGNFSYSLLVEKYKISQTQVARIIKKESWAWV